MLIMFENGIDEYHIRVFFTLRIVGLHVNTDKPGALIRRHGVARIAILLHLLYLDAKIVCA